MPTHTQHSAAEHTRLVHFSTRLCSIECNLLLYCMTRYMHVRHAVWQKVAHHAHACNAHLQPLAHHMHGGHSQQWALNPCMHHQHTCFRMIPAPAVHSCRTPSPPRRPPPATAAAAAAGGRCGVSAPVIAMMRSVSSGAVTVRDAAPARPPATRCPQGLELALRCGSGYDTGTPTSQHDGWLARSQ